MATIEERVNELIQVITENMKEQGYNAREVFLNGNCGNMYTIFAKYFKKEAVVPYEVLYEGYPYHILTSINDELFDITGKTSLEDYINYLRENNPKLTFYEKDFELRKIPVNDRSYRIRQQSDMYDYDIINEHRSDYMPQVMYRLDDAISAFKKDKEQEI